VLGVAQGCEDGGPPALGEVLRLVDDDRVEPFSLRQRLASDTICVGSNSSQYALSSSEPGRTPQPMPRLWNVPT
jgi:hypothetical protein